MNLSRSTPLPSVAHTPASPQAAPGLGSKGSPGGSGTESGLDFAGLMAAQLRHLSHVERQEFAAPAASTPQADPGRERRSSNDSDRLAKTASAREDAEVAQDDDSGPNRSGHGRTTRKNGVQRTPQRPEDAILSGATEWITQTPANGLTPQNLTTGAMSALQEQPLSARITLITDPRQTPNTESLASFAQSMGMDTEAIRTLLSRGQGSASNANGLPTMAGGPNALTSVAIETAGPSSGAGAPTGSNLPGNGLPAANLLAAASLANATESLARGQTMMGAMAASSDGAATLQASAGSGTSHLPLTGLSVSTTPASDSAGASLLGATASPSTFQALQQGVLPASVSGPLQNADQPGDPLEGFDPFVFRASSNLPMGDLLSGGPSTGGEPSAGHDSGGSSSSQGQSSGMPMYRDTASVAQNNAKFAAAAQATAPEPQNTFEALSEKLSTEMAARMHEQLQRGEWKMKFGLRPAHLGGVEIQLEMKDGQLQANLQVDNPVARDLLQQNSARLREALANLGIENPHVHVGQHSSHAGGQSHGNSSNRPQVGDNSAAGSTETGAEETNAARRRPDPQSMLDLYA